MCMSEIGSTGKQYARPFGWYTTGRHRRASAKTASPRIYCARLHARHRRTARSAPRRHTDTANIKAVHFSPPLGLERCSRADSARNRSLLPHSGSTRPKGKGLVRGSIRREPRVIEASLDHRCARRKRELEAVLSVLDLSLDAGDTTPRKRIMGAERGGVVTSGFWSLGS